MNVVFVSGPQPEKIDHPSIFLAGPTSRDPLDTGWRPEAIEQFEKNGFGGTLFVPEREDWSKKFEYYDQVEWEDKYLTGCSAILFWVPRYMPNMPAFTTNVEFGRFVGVRPCVYGRPPNAQKNRYLDWLYTKKTQWLPHETLDETVRSAMALAGPRMINNA